MKTLLLTNDDGYMSEGLQHLKKCLADDYDVYIVAPDRERSAVSMSLTINSPLRMEKIGPKEYTVDGTPTDCVNIALQRVLPRRPDFILSGMNLGENLGEDVFFSGTVAAAFVSNIYGIPAMAVSLVGDNSRQKKEEQFNFQEGANIARRVMEQLLPLENNRVVFNLNIPNPTDGNLVITTVGFKGYQPSIVDGTDPRGREFYWIGTGYPTTDGEEGCDIRVIEEGSISLSVLKYDLNCPDEMQKLRGALGLNTGTQSTEESQLKRLQQVEFASGVS